MARPAHLRRARPHPPTSPRLYLINSLMTHILQRREGITSFPQRMWVMRELMCTSDASELGGMNEQEIVMDGVRCSRAVVMFLCRGQIAPLASTVRHGRGEARARGTSIRRREPCSGGGFCASITRGPRHAPRCITLRRASAHGPPDPPPRTVHTWRDGREGRESGGALAGGGSAASLCARDGREAAAARSAWPVTGRARWGCSFRGLVGRGARARGRENGADRT